MAIYGGSAGGGKSWALLFEAMRHAGNPGFGAVIFRRTSVQVTNEGGLWDESLGLYPLAGAVPRVGDLEWRFPSGASVSFSHLQHETTKLNWQGSQVALIGFDELTHFSESQFFYMFSRNRSGCGVRPYIRATTNPDAGSWVKRFLAPWLARGHPLAARSGEVLWFIRKDGAILWARSPATLKAEHPGCDPKSCTFVRASIYDNPKLLEKDPGYLANLKALPPVEQARLLHGDWDVVCKGLVYPDLAARCEYDPAEAPAPAEGEAFGGIDFGFNNPFAALRAVLDADDVLWVTWERYGSRTTIGEHSRALPPGVRWYADPAGADQVAELQAAGHAVTPCVHLGHEPLMAGIDRVTERIQGGRLKVSKACPNLLREAGLYRYPDDARARSAGAREKPIDCDNHALSALRYLIVGVDRFRAIEGGPTRSRTAGREAAEAERLERLRNERHAAHVDPDNDLWWT